MFSQEIRWRGCIGGCLLIFLAACGGGGEAPVDPTGIINISVTDAPIDEVTEVNVQFAGVTLKPQSGDEIEMIFDPPKDFDLLTLTGGMTAELLPDTRVPVGPYIWIRLAVNAEFDNVFDSYAVIPQGQVELRVPSGSQSGLKLVSGFTVTQDQSTNMVIDWDLRKALTDPIGRPGLHLRPALRVTNMAVFGTLTGTVAEALVTDDSCTNDLGMDTGNAVYLYVGVVDTPGDIGDPDNEPFTTATVSQNESGAYVYEVNFLSVGEYTAAFTCQASDDDPEADDDIAFPVSHVFTIEDGATTGVDF
ncbi:MAG: DUF4382 domain-containing protein [Woeseiaceae bacterium]